MKNKNQNHNNFVYQHVTPDGKYYFGATNNLKQRWGSNGNNYKGTSLWPEIEKWGWDNIKHQVLFENQTRENALWIEDFLIKTAQEDGVCINKNRSGRITDNWNKYQNKYIHKNSNRKKKWNRDYYLSHKSYHRTYYLRKKYQKQLDEFGYIPLF